MSMHETLVSLSFLLLISLWATRRPLFVSGWSELLRLTDASGQRVPVVGDASIAMLLIVCMFVLPTKTKSGWNRSTRCIHWIFF